VLLAVGLLLLLLLLLLLVGLLWHVAREWFVLYFRVVQSMFVFEIIHIAIHLVHTSFRDVLLHILPTVVVT
jgi:hypothetical protein